MSKMSGLISLSKIDLVKKVREDSEALFKLRLKMANSSESMKTHQFKVYRRNIARYITAIKLLEVKQ